MLAIAGNDTSHRQPIPQLYVNSQGEQLNDINKSTAQESADDVNTTTGTALPISDHLGLFYCLHPYCKPDAVSLMTDTGLVGWVYGEEAQRAIRAYFQGTLQDQVFHAVNQKGKEYVISSPVRLGVVLHRDSIVTAICIDLDNHDGGNDNTMYRDYISRFFDAEPVVYTSRSGKGYHLFFWLDNPMPVSKFVAWFKTWGFNRKDWVEIFPKTEKLSAVFLPNTPNENGGDTYVSGTYQGAMIKSLPPAPSVDLTSDSLVFLRGLCKLGNRNNTLNKVAYELGLKGVAREEAKSLCLRGGYMCGMEKNEVERTFESGYTAGLKHSQTQATHSSTNAGGIVLSNYKEVACAGNAPQKICARPLGEIVQQLSKILYAKFGKIGGNLFVIFKEELIWIKNAAELFAVIKRLEITVQWRDSQDSNGCGLPTRAELLAALRQEAPVYHGVTHYPYWPVVKDFYVIRGVEDQYIPTGKFLEEFMAFFAFETEEYQELALILLLTYFWGGPAGHRPFFVIGPPENLFESNEGQATGKTSFVRLTAKLVGEPMGLALPQRNGYGDDLNKQILSEINQTRRVALLDNTTGVIRNPKMAELITGEYIEGRPSYGRQSRRLNVITYVATTNDLSFDADLASRSVLIRMAHCDREAHPLWLQEVDEFYNSHRKKIEADCIYKLQHGGRYPITGKHTRFADWDKQVLAISPLVNQLLERIHADSKLLNVDQTEISLFVALINERFRSLTELKMNELTEVFNAATDNNLSTPQVGRILKNARSRGLLDGLSPKNSRNGTPWVWTPTNKSGDGFMT